MCDNCSVLIQFLLLTTATIRLSTVRNLRLSNGEWIQFGVTARIHGLKPVGLHLLNL